MGVQVLRPQVSSFAWCEAPKVPKGPWDSLIRVENSSSVYFDFEMKSTPSEGRRIETYNPLLPVATRTALATYAYEGKQIPSKWPCCLNCWRRQSCHWHFSGETRAGFPVLFITRCLLLPIPSFQEVSSSVCFSFHGFRTWRHRRWNLESICSWNTKNKNITRNRRTMFNPKNNTVKPPFCTVSVLVCVLPICRFRDSCKES